MEISHEVLDDIRQQVSSLEVKGDAVIIDALKIPVDIFQQGIKQRRKYRDTIEQLLLDKHRVGEVFVMWSADGDCVLELAV